MTTGEVLTEKIFGSTNSRLFSQDVADIARARLTKKLSTLQTGIDPTMLPDLIKVGGYYFERGIREFASWSANMIEDFGDGIYRPYMIKLSIKYLK